MATDAQVDAALAKFMFANGPYCDDTRERMRAALAAAEAASAPAGAQLLNDLANRGLGEVMGKITFSDNATADEINVYWAERFAGVDAAIRNKAIAALKWPPPPQPSEEDVARAISKVWENEYNHLIGTPLFKATVNAAYMALLQRGKDT